MTVAEMIDILKNHDPADTILVDGYEYGLSDVFAKNIIRIRFCKNVNISAYAGEHEEDTKGEFSGVVIGRGNEL